MDLKLKKEFRGETGLDVFIWSEGKEIAYTEDYVEWLEAKINYAQSSLKLPTKKEMNLELESRIEDIKQTSSIGSSTYLLLSYRLGFEEYHDWLLKR
jgi:hypothetical protein